MSKQDIQSNELDPQLSYAQGIRIAQLIEAKLKSQHDLGIVIDKKKLIQGFSDKILGSSEISTQKVTTLNEQLYRLMQIKSLEKNANFGLKNLDAGQAFLSKNIQKKSIEQTPSGLQFEVLKQAQGAKPQSQDLVTLHFSATHIDGRKISSSAGRQKPLSVNVNQLFNGFKEGVKLMSVGSSYQFYIPSKLAYGLVGDVSLNIGPNEVLIYQVDLISIEQQISS